MRTQLKDAGFAAPDDRPLGGERRHTVVAELAAIVGLTISTVIAATVVSVGMARASAVDGIIDNEGGLFAVALLLGLLFIVVGGVSLLPHRRPRH